LMGCEMEVDECVTLIEEGKEQGQHF